MKRATTICSWGQGETLNLMNEKYKAYVPAEFRKKYIFNGMSLQLPLEPDSPAFERAMEYIRENGMRYRLFSNVYYTKKELEEVQFFSLNHLPTSLEMEGTSPDRDYTKYEIICSECGFRSKLQSDIVVDGPCFKKHKNKKICELHPNIVVSSELKELIENSGVTGVSFNYRVRDYKHREIPEYHVMTVPCVLPPMSSSAWFFSRKDYSCGHYKVSLDSEAQYEREKMDGALDFNLTHEYVNNGRSQLLIVSAKVRKLFKENKIRAHFTPVTLL